MKNIAIITSLLMLTLTPYSVASDAQNPATPLAPEASSLPTFTDSHGTTWTQHGDFSKLTTKEGMRRHVTLFSSGLYPIERIELCETTHKNPFRVCLFPNENHPTNLSSNVPIGPLTNGEEPIGGFLACLVNEDFGLPQNLVDHILEIARQPYAFIDRGDDGYDAFGARALLDSENTVWYVERETSDKGREEYLFTSVKNTEGGSSSVMGTCIIIKDIGRKFPSIQCVFEQSHKSFAKLMKKKGYFTGANGKSFIARPDKSAMPFLNLLSGKGFFPQDFARTIFREALYVQKRSQNARFVQRSLDTAPSDTQGTLFQDSDGNAWAFVSISDDERTLNDPKEIRFKFSLTPMSTARSCVEFIRVGFDANEQVGVAVKLLMPHADLFAELIEKGYQVYGTTCLCDGTGSTSETDFLETFVRYKFFPEDVYEKMMIKVCRHRGNSEKAAQAPVHIESVSIQDGDDSTQVQPEVSGLEKAPFDSAALKREIQEAMHAQVESTAINMAPLPPTIQQDVTESSSLSADNVPAHTTRRASSSKKIHDIAWKKEGDFSIPAVTQHHMRHVAYHSETLGSLVRKMDLVEYTKYPSPVLFIKLEKKHPRLVTFAKSKGYHGGLYSKGTYLSNRKSGASPTPLDEFLDFLTKHRILSQNDADTIANDAVQEVPEVSKQDTKDHIDTGDMSRSSSEICALLTRTALPTPEEALDSIRKAFSDLTPHRQAQVMHFINNLQEEQKKIQATMSPDID